MKIEDIEFAACVCLAVFALAMSIAAICWVACPTDPISETDQ